jgi:uncharacterized protein (DUF934 family)
MIVTDTGFQDDDWQGDIVALADLPANDAQGIGVDLRPDADPSQLTHRLADIGLIRIAFPSFSDGRGFTLARLLRLAGYTGRLRAHGHVIADQYAMARRSGFDEVEISADLAARQPQDQWLARADWRAHDYQSRLRG